MNPDSLPPVTSNLPHLPAPVSMVDGIPCYSPDRSGNEADYPLEAHSRLFAIEDRSFWFRGRNRILRWMLASCREGEACKFLEIGCGTGFVLKMVADAFPLWEVYGSDLHLAALSFARRRNVRATLFQADITQFPGGAWCDVVGLFDVIEHLADDVMFLKAAREMLRPGGRMIISVPQHPWLWSAHDCRAGHKRRYTRAELQAKLAEAGLSAVRTTSYVTALLPVLAIQRWIGRMWRNTGPGDSSRALAPGAVLNAVFGTALRIDEAAIRAGFSLPWGGSLLAVAQRPV